MRGKSEGKLDDILVKARKLKTEATNYITQRLTQTFSNKHVFGIQRFSNPGTRLDHVLTAAEISLERIIGLLEDAGEDQSQLNPNIAGPLIKEIEPLYGTTVLIDKGFGNTIKDKLYDPISEYLLLFSEMAELFDGEPLVVANPVFQFLINAMFRIDGKLTDQLYDEFCAGSKELGRMVLRHNLRVANTPVEPFIIEYVDLLTQLDGIFSDDSDYAYRGIERREIPGTSLFDNRRIQIVPNLSEEILDRLELIKMLETPDDLDKAIEKIAIYKFSNHYKNGLFYKEKFIQAKYNHHDGVSYQGIVVPHPIKRSDAVGIDEQIYKVGQLLSAFEMGRRIPNFALVGDPGVGKTLTLQIIANELEELRVIYITTPEFISGMGKLIDDLSKKNYRCLIYVDDFSTKVYEFGNDNLEESFKTNIEGFKGTPENIALALSMNWDVFHKMPEAVQSRFPEIFFYKFDERSVHKLVRLYCRLEDVPYQKDLTEQVKNHFSDRKVQISPRGIRDYIQSYAIEQSMFRLSD